MPDVNPDRRQLLRARAVSGAAPSLLAYVALGTASAQASERGDLALPVALETANQSLLSASTKELAQRYQAIAYVLSSPITNSDDIVTIATRIANGDDRLKSDELSSRLQAVFRQSGKNALELHKQPYGIVHGFDGVVDAPAALSLLVTSVAGRASDSGDDISSFLRTLPAPDDIDLINRATLRSLVSAHAGDALTTILGTPALRAITGLDVHADVSELVDGLPQAARDLARKLGQIDFTDTAQARRAVETALADGISAALGEAGKQYQVVSTAVGQGSKLYRDGFGDLATLAKDMRSVASIGSYVLENLFNDPKTARQINAGAELASVAFNVGLMMSTGGIGVLASAGNLLSGLGAIQGIFGGGSSGDATKAMLAQIGQQIETLRREMHARFDRVEALQLKALNILEQISIDLKQTRVLVAGKLDELKIEVGQLDKYVKNQARQEKVEKFNLLASKARAAIAKPNDYLKKDRTEILLEFLNYALEDSRHPAFVSDPTSDLSVIVPTVGRVDLAVAMFKRAGEVLSLNNLPVLERNPLEWARGMQAYLETRACFTDVDNPEIKARAEVSWSAGHAMYAALSAFCTKDNLSLASAAYGSAGSVLLADLGPLTRGVFPGDAAPLMVGRPPAPVLTSPATGWAYGAYPARVARRPRREIPAQAEHPGTKFVVEKSVPDFGASWKFVATGDGGDPLSLGLKTNLLRLQETGAGEWLDRPGTRFAYYKTYKIYGRKNKDLGPITLVDFWPGTWHKKYYRFNAWDISPRGNFDVAGFLAGIRDEITDEIEIGKWIDQIHSQRGRPSISKYLEVSAAIALFTTGAAWRITDQLDDPWNAGIASGMIRSIEDLSAVFRSLSNGVGSDTIKFLKPIDEAFVAEYSTMKERFGSFPEPGAPPKFVTWADMGMWLPFERLMRTVMANSITDTSRTISRLGSNIAGDRGVGILERMLAKFGGYLEYSKS